jgi:hypothetical protein
VLLLLVVWGLGCWSFLWGGRARASNGQFL